MFVLLGDWCVVKAVLWPVLGSTVGEYEGAAQCVRVSVCGWFYSIGGNTAKSRCSGVLPRCRLL